MSRTDRRVGGLVQATNRNQIEKGQKAPESTVASWVWRGAVGLFAAALLVALGLTAALALGWRSPTPRRAPDWTNFEQVWRQYGDGAATVTDDGYRIRLAQPQQHAWAVADQLTSDFDLELDVRSLITSQDVGYGLLYRYQDADNTYLFAIGGDGYYTIAAIQDGELEPLRVWQQWPHVRRGTATNRLRVRCIGARCRFYINGEFTAELDHHAFLTGELGLWAESFSDNELDVVFEDMRMWSAN